MVEKLGENRLEELFFSAQSFEYDRAMIFGIDSKEKPIKQSLYTPRNKIWSLFFYCKVRTHIIS